MAITLQEHLRRLRADPPRYEERYLAFVDIIGWTTLVKQSSRSDPSLVSKLAEATTLIAACGARAEALRTKGRGGDAPVTCAWFSDSVILSAPVHPDAQATMLLMVAAMCVELLDMGFYTRGALVRGLICQTPTVTFGPALVEAYELEQDVAKSPRILVTPEAREISDSYMRLDSDGLEYLDYYRMFETIEPSEHDAHLRRALKLVNENEAKNVNCLRFVSKDRWLKNYLEEVLRRPRLAPAPAKS
jgi:hypothetical protein